MGGILFMSAWLIKPSIPHINNILLDRLLFCLKSNLSPEFPGSNGQSATLKTFPFPQRAGYHFGGVKRSGEAVFIICFGSRQLRLPTLNLLGFINLMTTLTT